MPCCAHAVLCCACARAVQVFREDGLLSQDSGMGPGMDWYEGALVRPADVLRDMLRAVRPDLVEASHH